MFVRITSALRLLTKSSKCDRTFAFISSVLRVVGIEPPRARVDLTRLFSGLDVARQRSARALRYRTLQSFGSPQRPPFALPRGCREMREVRQAGSSPALAVEAEPTPAARRGQFCGQSLGALKPSTGAASRPDYQVVRWSLADERARRRTLRQGHSRDDLLLVVARVVPVVIGRNRARVGVAAAEVEPEVVADEGG